MALKIRNLFTSRNSNGPDVDVRPQRPLLLSRPEVSERRLYSQFDEDILGEPEILYPWATMDIKKSEPSLLECYIEWLRALAHSPHTGLDRYEVMATYFLAAAMQYNPTVNDVNVRFHGRANPLKHHLSDSEVLLLDMDIFPNLAYRAVNSQYRSYLHEIIMNRTGLVEQDSYDPISLNVAICYCLEILDGGDSVSDRLWNSEDDNVKHRFRGGVVDLLLDYLENEYQLNREILETDDEIADADAEEGDEATVEVVEQAGDEAIEEVVEQDEAEVVERPLLYGYFTTQVLKLLQYWYEDLGIEFDEEDNVHYSGIRRHLSPQLKFLRETLRRRLGRGGRMTPVYEELLTFFKHADEAIRIQNVHRANLTSNGHRR